MNLLKKHLLSIAKVHQAQSELLAEFGVERDLRKEIGEGVSLVSSKISSLVNTAEKIDSKIMRAEEIAKSLKETVAGLDSIIK